MQYKFKMIISICIEASLPEEEAIQELAQETNYSIPNTENVTVIETEIIDVQ